MRQRIKVPNLGEGATTATVVEWMVQVGDVAAEGQALLSVALDKVDLDIPSPVAGTVVERLVDEGDGVAVGDAICIIES